MKLRLYQEIASVIKADRSIEWLERVATKYPGYGCPARGFPLRCVDDVMSWTLICRISRGTLESIGSQIRRVSQAAYVYR